MRGEDVSVVQQLLKDQGYFTYHQITGYFGTITEAAVKAFQKANGLVADGIVGPVTGGVMNKILAGPSHNENTGDVYTVQPGDSLWKIGQKFNVSLDKLFAANGLSSSSVIYPGQKIKIPGKNGISVPEPNESYITHVIVKGDTLWKLSNKYGVTVADITKANGISASAILYVGQTIKIPKREIPVKPTPGPQYGELLDWWTEAQYVLKYNVPFTVTDFYTGTSFKAVRTFGANHADCEPLTSADTAAITKLWNQYHTSYWSTRPVIITINGRKLAASMSASFHAGLDSAPNGAYVNNRSGGYGYGQNFDAIKGNGADGHFDIHFLNSTSHGSGAVNQNHQRDIKIAAGK